MFRALEIARYTINYINKQNEEITNLKLQKILYYIQAAFLVETGEPCFPDEIVCWQHGPVVRIVYDEFRIYEAGSIPKQERVKKMVFKNGMLKFEEQPYQDPQMSTEQKKLIDRVLNGLMSYDAWYLVDRTHEEAPWKDMNNNYNAEILTDKIKEYFVEEKNKERMYGKFS